MASQKTLRNALRTIYIDKLIQFLNTEGEEVLRAKDNEIALPVIDAEGNEEFIRIVVSVPTGSNKGADPYDGYALAEEYAMHLKEKAEKDEKAAKDKAKKIEKDKIYRQKRAEAKAKREQE